jgi:O-antigen/teichoic acid export membrane protein
MLSVNDYGIYNVLLAMMGYIGIFSSFGLPSVFQRYIPEFYERREIANLKRLIRQGSLLMIALSAIFILLVILFSSQVGRLLKIDNWLDYFKLFSLGIIFSLEGSLLAIALTSLFLHKYFVISNIVYVYLRACILYFLLKAGWGLEGLLLGEAVAYGILMVMFICCYYSKFSRLNTANSKPPFPMRRFFRYGGFSYLNEMGVMVLDVSTDFLIISIFLGPLAVGIYSFANRVSELFSRILPHTLLQEVMRPSFFSKFAKTNNQEDLQKMGNLLVKIIAFCSIPLTLGIFILGDKVILHVFDPRYISGLKILWIVAAFLTIRAFQFPLGLILQAAEKVNIIFYSKIFSVYNLILDLIVVKFWGITGIALVTGSAILFQNLFMYFFIYKYIRLRLCIRSLAIIALNSMVMSLSIFWLRKYVVGFVSLIVIVIVGVMIYLAIAFLNKAFTQEERTTVNSIIGKPIFVF